MSLNATWNAYRQKRLQRGHLFQQSASHIVTAVRDLSSRSLCAVEASAWISIQGWTGMKTGKCSVLHFQRQLLPIMRILILPLAGSGVRIIPILRGNGRSLKFPGISSPIFRTMDTGSLCSMTVNTVIASRTIHLNYACSVPRSIRISMRTGGNIVLFIPCFRMKTHWKIPTFLPRRRSMVFFTARKMFW